MYGRTFPINRNCGKVISLVTGRVAFEPSGTGLHKRIRRGQKIGPKQGVTPSLCNIYYVNKNGYKSKAQSLKQLIVEQNVDILLLAETKVYSKSGVKIEGFQVFPAVRKKNWGGGLIIAIRHGLCSSMIIDFGDNAEFLTVRLNFGQFALRLILAYGPQGKEKTDLELKTF